MSRRVHWPALPFYKLAQEQPPGSARKCSVEFADGRMARYELVELEPGSSSVMLRPQDWDATEQVPLAQIRSIRLIRPVDYVVD